MKILYFGVFEKPYDTEVYVSNTLEKLGHTVDKYQVGNVGMEELPKLLKNDYDFVLISKSWFKGDYMWCKEFLKRHPILKVGWFWDLCWGTKREWLVHEHPLFSADLVFTTDGGNDDKWKKYNINHRVIRQGIYEPEAVMGTPKDEYKYDVVFVGTDVHANAFGWQHRTDLLQFLEKTYGPRFRHFGKVEEIRNMDLNDLYASAKVVVGDSVVRPNYWSNRIYETLGRGGFLIFPEVPGLENEFERYKHYIPYKVGDWEAIKEKIDYYIFHDDERERIRKAGFEHCKKNHTYTKRCEELIKQVYEYKLSRPELLHK